MISNSISVVIPLYNKKRFIRRAIDSALDQSFQPIEIVIVDDGSTDGSGDIVRQFHNPKIRLISQPNSGASEARNRGIKEAKGNLIAFLDSDDEWEEDYLATIIKLFKLYANAGMFSTGYVILEKNNGIIRIRNKFNPNKECFLLENPYQSYLGDPLFYTSSVVVPKNLLIEFGGFTSGIKLGEDIELWLKISAKYPVAYSSLELVRYRRGTGQNTTEQSSEEGYQYLKGVAEKILYIEALTQEKQKSLALFCIRLSLLLAKEQIKYSHKSLARSGLFSINPGRVFFFYWLWLLFLTFLPDAFFHILVNHKLNASEQK